MLCCFSTTFLHVLCFKAVRDTAKCFRHGMHYLVAHLITIVPLNHLIIIVNMIAIIPYVYLLLCYKPIRDKLQGKEVIPHCLIHILCVLKRWGTSFSCHGSTSMALLHISWVLKRSGIWWNAFGMIHMISLYIFCMLKQSVTWYRVYDSLGTTPSCIPWDPKIYSSMCDKIMRIHPMIQKTIHPYTNQYTRSLQTGHFIDVKNLWKRA